MIENKDKLKQYIAADHKANLGEKPITLEVKFRSGFPYLVYKYLELLRKLEYTCYRRDHSKNRFLSLFFAQKVKLLFREKNRLGLKLGIETSNHIGSGIRIAHSNVILNGYIGDGCVFHGNNVVGNKRTGDKTGIPKIGKNVDVGVGAIIIGNIEIADNCVIGAGAVVTKSFPIPGTVLAGVPAKEIKK